jgi:transcriptional regulator GlxA family with amidase domain
VQRLQRAIARLPHSSLADVAFGEGFSDQAHLSREFRELAGLSPGEYRARVAGPSHHVALPGP